LRLESLIDSASHAAGLSACVIAETIHQYRDRFDGFVD